MNLMNNGIWSAFAGIPIIVVPDSKKQNKTHKKKRINKKWAKRYGYKQIVVNSKGWKIKNNTDGSFKFVK